MADEQSLERVDRQPMVKRVVLALIAVPVGWVVGVYFYFGLVYVFDDGPQPGDIHVGALLLGLVGMIVLPLAVWRWSARSRGTNK